MRAKENPAQGGVNGKFVVLCLECKDMEERIRRLELNVEALNLRVKKHKSDYCITLVDYLMDDSWLVPGGRPEEQEGDLVIDECLFRYEEPTKRSFIQRLFTFF